jgi:hypothetical protein
MAIWSLSDAGLQAMGGQLTASSLLTNVTSGAANAVGSWTQMHASTTFPVSLIRIHFGKAGVSVAATNTQFMFNVGVGAAGLETIIAQDIAAGGSLAFSTWEFPLSVPAGSRLSIQTRSLTASKVVTMGMMIFGGGLGIESSYKATTYGAVTSGSRGTILTAPGTANSVEAAWTVIIAATTLPIRFLLVGVASPNTATATAADLLIDIGVGAAGVESSIISDIACSVSANEDIIHSRPLLFPVNIPVGSRLVARYRGTSTLTTASPSITLTGFC